MSTHDVPGANPKNHDELAMGCWAEHDDKSLIFVEGSEGGRVVFTVFDMAQDPPIEYRDSMAESAFKDQFSWKPKKKKSEKWTWHDKSPFPWDRIIDSGGRSGPGYASADDLLTAAQRIMQSRDARSQPVDPADYEHMAGTRIARKVIKTIQDALQNMTP